ncbi:MAG: hypothetical protein IT208_11515 [Chthonomonadales bacterium]|nr:hypothetical protein [Chthonomonadales bacterium]
MEAPRAAHLLQAWERARHHSAPRRALALLEAAAPGEPPERLASWSVGRRDAALLGLRERLFGPAIAALADCPACGERNEVAFEAASIRLPRGPAEAVPLEVGGLRLRLRPVDSGDLLALAADRPADARRYLAERCCLSASRMDCSERPAEPAAACELPPEAMDAVSERLAEADPQADVRLALHCARCERAWEEPFDIATFLWVEVEEWARRTLHEVHLLASAYGWREADILAMSPSRRAAYLEMSS